MNQNPWAGLASYQDPAAGSTLLFCGRDNESYDLAALVDDNIFCTLYGKSGTGKTSLLNAGVFPRLREMGYLPLSIRLGMEAMDTTFQQCVVSRLAQVTDLQTADTVALPADDQDEQWLWAWFARTRFVDGDGKTRFAVLVFDQFEEVFRSRRDEAEALLRQIHFMMDPSHSLGESYDYNFRFLASIREDDLYLLEDSLDRNFMGDMKQCRYRLNALTDEGARDVILKPGKGLFDEGGQDGIVGTIIDIARSADGSINTNILSLVCSRIYEEYRRSGAKNISLELVRGFVSGNPFEQFYNEVTRDLGEKEKRFIEDRLVDAAGRRGSVSEPDFEKNVPNGAHLLEGASRILQRVASGTEGRSYRIELIHDSFCAPLADQKLKRAVRRRRRIIAALSAVALVVAAIAAYIVVMSIRNARQTREILIQQEKFYAYRASQLLDEGDTYTALLLLNELTDPDGQFAKIPLQPEAERQIRRAVQMYDTAEWRVVTTYSSGTSRFRTIPKVTNDKQYLIEGVVGKLLIYDFRTGTMIRQLQLSTWNRLFPSYSISNDGKLIAFLDYDYYNPSTPQYYIYNIETDEKITFDVRTETPTTNGDTFYNRFIRIESPLMFSSDNRFVFGICDSVSYNPEQNIHRYLSAFSTFDSGNPRLFEDLDFITPAVHHFPNLDIITAVEDGNANGANISAMDTNGIIHIYDKKKRVQITEFSPGECDVWKYINDEVMLIKRHDGVYKYEINKGKWSKIIDKKFNMRLHSDILLSTTQFSLSNKDTLFIYDKNSYELEDWYKVDTTKYYHASICEDGKIFLINNEMDKVFLLEHNKKEKIALASVTDDIYKAQVFLNNGCVFIKNDEGYNGEGNVMEIVDVNNNRVLYSDTVKCQRDIEDISPSENYLILEYYVMDDWEDLWGDGYLLTRLFDLSTKEYVHTFDTSEFLHSLHFLNNDEDVVYLPKGDGYKWKKYNLKTRFSEYLSPDSESFYWHTIHVNKNSNMAFVLNTDNLPLAYNIETGKTTLLSEELGALQQAEFSTDGKYIVTISMDNIIRIIDSRNMQVVDSKSFDGKIKCMDQHGNYFIGTNQQGEYELWSMHPLAMVQNIDAPYLKYSKAISFCDDDKNLVFYPCATYDNGDTIGFLKIPILTQQDIIEKARVATNGRKLTEEEKSLLLE